MLSRLRDCRRLSSLASWPTRYIQLAGTCRKWQMLLADGGLLVSPATFLHPSRGTSALQLRLALYMMAAVSSFAFDAVPSLLHEE